MPDERYEKLRRILKSYDSVLVMFSGGTDSVLLARAAVDTLKDRAVGMIADSPSLPRRDLLDAHKMAERFSLKLIVAAANELDLPAYRENAKDRCYHCKQAIAALATAQAKRLGLSVVVDGLNLDDLGDYRPGIRAADEAGVKHPFIEAGLHKADIRELSKDLGLPTWNKPAAACLASRIPYGTPITRRRLGRIEHIEDVLYDLGFVQVRARDHDPILRIETAENDWPRLLDDAIRAKVVAAGEAEGFRYVTLDMKGYRTGSLNEGLERDGGNTSDDAS